METLKHLSNFWRTLEMSGINCEINLILTCSANCVISSSAANQATTFSITDTRIYVPVVTLSTQDNVKITIQSTLNWNKYQLTAEPVNGQTHN